MMVFFRKGHAHQRIAGTVELNTTPEKTFDDAVTKYWKEVEALPGETTEFYVEGTIKGWKGVISCGFSLAYRMDIVRQINHNLRGKTGYVA